MIKFSSASSPSELRERRWCTSRFCIVPHLWHRQLSRFRTRWRSAVYDSGSSRSGGRLKLVGFVRFIFISQPIAPLQLRTEFASRVSWTGCTPAIHFSPAHPGAPSDPHRELPGGGTTAPSRAAWSLWSSWRIRKKDRSRLLACRVTLPALASERFLDFQHFYWQNN